jgi:hypothetical protein
VAECARASRAMQSEWQSAPRCRCKTARGIHAIANGQEPIAGRWSANCGRAGPGCQVREALEDPLASRRLPLLQAVGAMPYRRRE